MSESEPKKPAAKKAKRTLQDLSLEPTRADSAAPETVEERSGSQDRRAFYEEQRPPHYGE